MEIIRPLGLAILITLVSACGEQAATPPPTSRPATQATAAPTAEATAVAPDAEATAAMPAGGATTDVLSGTSWQWVELTDPTQQVQIAGPAAYTIAFDQGQVSIQADCNRSTGGYTLADGGALTIALGPTTLAACPPESRSDEFLQKLGQVAVYSIQGDRLLLELPVDSGTLELRR